MILKRNIMKKDFNPRQYRNDYLKSNYKQFNARLSPDEFKKIKELCKEKRLSHRQLILLSYDYLKKVSIKSQK